MQNKPKLRFKEFNDEWQVKKLGDIGELRNGIAKGNDSFGHGHKFINLQDVFGKDALYNSDYGLVETTEQERRLNNLQQGDVIFVRSSVKPTGVGLPSVVMEDLEDTVFSGFLIRFREHEKCLNLSYKKYCFIVDNFRKEVLKRSSTSANTNINQDNLSVIRFNVPSLPEQQKIAEFLSKVDEVIAEREAEVKDLEQKKKGLMQKLFSQQLRFTDSNNQPYPDWKETQIGKICKTFSGGTPSVTCEKYYNGDIPFIKSGEIHSENTEVFITKEGLDNSSAKLVEKGDLLFALYGATSGEVDISRIDGAINQAILCIRSDEINLTYLKNILNFNKDKILCKYLQGGQGNLSAEIVKSLTFIFPTPDEQEKIANVLSKLDELIEEKKALLSDWQLFKKGLLQQMFV